MFLVLKGFKCFGDPIRWPTKICSTQKRSSNVDKRYFENTAFDFLWATNLLEGYNGKGEVAFIYYIQENP